MCNAILTVDLPTLCSRSDAPADSIAVSTRHSIWQSIYTTNSASRCKCVIENKA